MSDETTEGRPALDHPDFPAQAQIGWLHGQIDDNIVYRLMKVHGGQVGGRWAYWTPLPHGVLAASNDNLYSVIIDDLFNSGPLLAGQLVEPWNGVDSTAWVRIKGWQVPNVEPREYLERSQSEGRYERNDVDRIDKEPSE